VKLVFVCKKNLDDVKHIKKSNPALFNLINPNADADVDKVLILLCKKKNSNIGDFKVMIVETIFDIIPYALIDPDYVRTHYGNGVSAYDLYSVTCDISKFMNNEHARVQIEQNIGDAEDLDVVDADDPDVVVTDDVSDDVESGTDAELDTELDTELESDADAESESESESDDS
jgi:hypothetical protein